MFKKIELKFSDLAIFQKKNVASLVGGTFIADFLIYDIDSPYSFEAIGTYITKMGEIFEDATLKVNIEIEQMKQGELPDEITEDTPAELLFTLAWQDSYVMY